MKRELWEELNIEANEICLYDTLTHCYQASGLEVHLRFLLVGTIAGKLMPKEGQTVAWLTPEEALALPLLEADEPILRRLAKEGIP